MTRRYRMRRVAELALTGLLALSPSITAAQVIDPLAQPNLELYSAGNIRAVLAQPDGSVIVGGAFTSVFDSVSQLSIPRRNLAKFAANGALDFTWQPDADGEVFALARLADGSILVGGNFASIGGQSRVGIAKISVTNGAATPGWNAGSNGAAQGFAVAADGSIYVGGPFTTIGGLPRAGLAKLNSTTALADPAWNPGIAGFYRVGDVAVDNGFVYFGGFFSRADGGCCLARYSASGSGALDTAWAAGLSGIEISDITFDSAGRALVGGFFSTIGGQPRSGIARLSTNGSGQADAWNPSATAGSVLSIWVDATDNVYVGGGFSSIGGVSSPRLARLSATTGTGDPSFSPSPDGLVREIAIDSAGAIIAGGIFTTLQTQPALALARVQATGSVLPAAYVQSTGAVYATVHSTDGTYVGGKFARANNERRSNLLRLRNDGLLDLNWSPRVDCPQGRCVTALAVDAVGDVYVGGSFSRGNDIARSSAAKFDRNGSLLAWNPGGFLCSIGTDTSCVYALAVDASGAAYAGGGSQFTAGFLRRISPGGSFDATWVAQPDGFVRALKVEPAGGLLVGGSFATIAGAARNGAARVSTTSPASVDPVFVPNVTGGEVDAIAVDAVGRIYLGGGFTSIGGQPRAAVGRVLGTTGALDATWNPGATCVAGFFCVGAIALDANGDVFAGGSFSAIGGAARSHIAKLSQASGMAVPTWAAPLATDAEAPFMAALALRDDGALVVGGGFTAVSAQGRRLLAALPATSDRMFGDGFE